MTQVSAHAHAPGTHGDGHHEHPPHLGHHWETPKQQFEAGKLGMWLFLATEVLLFGGLFVGYSVWRTNHPDLFSYGSHLLDTKWGAINTVVLILSSLTMAWGVTAAQQNKIGLLKVMLILTLIGAATFMVIKYIEYTHKFHEGWYPGPYLYQAPAHSESFEHGVELLSRQKAELAALPGPVLPVQPEGLPPVEVSTVPRAPAGPAGVNLEAVDLGKAETAGHASHIHPAIDPEHPRHVHMFLNIYFMMTGLHGIHVLVGMVVIAWLLYRTFRGEFSDQYFTPIDLGGLYWHVVDLIWIFLFPLFYLIH